MAPCVNREIGWLCTIDHGDGAAIIDGDTHGFLERIRDRDLDDILRSLRWPQALDEELPSRRKPANARGRSPRRRRRLQSLRLRRDERE